jgi:hypothetical protein
MGLSREGFRRTLEVARSPFALHIPRSWQSNRSFDAGGPWSLSHAADNGRAVGHRSRCSVNAAGPTGASFGSDRKVRIDSGDVAECLLRQGDERSDRLRTSVGPPFSACMYPPRSMAWLTEGVAHPILTKSLRSGGTAVRFTLGHHPFSTSLCVATGSIEESDGLVTVSAL